MPAAFSCKSELKTPDPERETAFGVLLEPPRSLVHQAVVRP